MLKKIKDKIGLVIIGSSIMVSILLLIQIGVVPLLSSAIASVVGNILTWSIISIVLAGVTLTSIYSFKGRNVKGSGNPLMELDYSNALQGKVRKEEKIYNSLNIDNQKIYLEIIENNRDDSLFDKFNDDFVKQIISTCDSEIEWYIHVASKRGASDKEQKMVINAISLKNKAINYLNDSKEVNIKENNKIINKNKR